MTAKNTKTADSINKKGFIMYLDYKPQIDMLTNEQRGKLLTCIFEYHESGEFDTDDPVISFAMAGLIAQFKRDHAKYAEKVEYRKEAGRKGGLAKASNAKQHLANLADRDSVSESVTVSDSETNIKEPPSPRSADTPRKGESVDEGERISHLEDRKLEPPPHSARPPSSDVERFVVWWNRVAEQAGLPKATKVTPQRAAKIKARIKEGIGDSTPIIASFLLNSKFHKGDNNTKWKANLDWLIRNQGVWVGIVENHVPAEKPAYQRTIEDEGDAEWARNRMKMIGAQND